MKYFITIDRNSFCKNPKWPRSSRKPCGYYEGMITIIDGRIERDIQPIFSMDSEPKYLFDYISTKVQCIDCKKEFFHTKLKSDEFGFDSYSNTICPECGCFDCCRLDFETIDSIIKE